LPTANKLNITQYQYEHIIVKATTTSAVFSPPALRQVYLFAHTLHGIEFN